jgi:hypothetical protein
MNRKTIWSIDTIAKSKESSVINNGGRAPGENDLIKLLKNKKKKSSEKYRNKKETQIVLAHI